MPDYTVCFRCVSILNSYKTRSWKMRGVLKKIREADGDKTIVFQKRSLFSLKMEWICHNFLYMIGYQRWRTQDCDLDYPADHPEWLYILCGLGVTWGFAILSIILVWLLVW